MRSFEEIVLGFAIGDALGLPVEGLPRRALVVEPVSNYTVGGPHNVNIGTWSDDTSMLLAAIDAIDKEIIYSKFLSKLNCFIKKSKYCSMDKAFDISEITLNAITNFSLGIDALLCGATDSSSSTNSSMNRMIPIAYYLMVNNLNKDAEFEIIRKTTIITHNIPKVIISNAIYFYICKNLLMNKSKIESIKEAIDYVMEYYLNNELFINEFNTTFKRLLDINSFMNFNENEISSTNYTVDTLESVIWCFLNTQTYKGALIKCVNLGHDTDGITALCAALCSIYYGLEEVPYFWKQKLVKRELILDITRNFINRI